MTKEPIMIDGVNVSECEFFSSGLGYCTIGLLANDGTHICECEQNCYYKQLKRKEQEYNRLSNLITSTKAYELTCSNCRDAILTAPTISGRTKFSQIEVEESSLKNIIKQLNQLEADNKKLKELVKTRIEDLCDSCGASSMMPMPCKVYEQALQEIKEIAEDDCKTCTVKLLGEDEINCKRCYKTKILQKCEVIDE